MVEANPITKTELILNVPTWVITNKCINFDSYIFVTYFLRITG